MANDDFSKLPRRADSKNPIFFFSRFLGLGHLQGLGVRRGRILGVPSIEPFLGEGGGPAGGLYRTPPPPRNENPASPVAPAPTPAPMCTPTPSLRIADFLNRFGVDLEEERELSLRLKTGTSTSIGPRPSTLPGGLVYQERSHTFTWVIPPFCMALAVAEDEGPDRIASVEQFNAELKAHDALALQAKVLSLGMAPAGIEGWERGQRCGRATVDFNQSPDPTPMPQPHSHTRAVCNPPLL